MAPYRWLRIVFLGTSLGVVVGLFIVFIAFINAMTAVARPETRETAAQQRSEASFQNMTRDEWISKQKDPDHVLGRIAVSQARAGNVDSAVENVNKIEKLDKNIIRNVAVYEMVHRVVQFGKVDKPEEKLAPVLKKAKEIAKSIDDPLLRADALRRIADVQDQYMDDPESRKEAQALYAEAADAVLKRPQEPDNTPIWAYNPWLIAWPIGLGIFAGLFIALIVPLLASASPRQDPPAGATEKKPKEDLKEEEEEEEDEAEEEEEEAQIKTEEPAAEAPSVATSVAPVESLSSDDGFLDSLGASTPPSTPPEPVEEATLTAEESMVADTLLPAPPSAASPSKLLASAAPPSGTSPALPAAPPVPPAKLMVAAAQTPETGAGDAPEKKAKQAVATMLAKGAAKTMLAKSGHLTKLADSTEPLPLPEDGRKPAKKG